ncbi:MAG: isoamylase early set domain-containing protein [Nitrospiraceae bacterium]|nr:isoamylase early set domain-containing protein [Nitrospiraceae bacterium]
MAIADTVKQMKRSISSGRPAGQDVEFTFIAPNAGTVTIAGPFNNWDPRATPMKKEKNGAWKIKLKLAPGRCEYKYVVDGAWVDDASCPELVHNSFGTRNCVITVH